MTAFLYQVKAGDGFKMKVLQRKNSFFNSPEEAVSEALVLKEGMDKRYKHGIQWDYKGKMVGSVKKLKFLRGYLEGDRDTPAFYLQIIKVENEQDELQANTPKKPKKVTQKDKTVMKRVLKLHQ
ncbi:hypothetical protein EJF36_02310 [Bacillus sp. HMF5848]|uniref:hypothetical protein n=1 Tax=Bacillus sp. HMF5848 TaxID=2495421 RepID=UPI000F7813C6|nr:hypothetical protein [Bacillus sp. HMF5848]RSK25818.1 hypothetical protein EJF36_02310 [Bacillus sp. HMF5848]